MRVLAVDPGVTTGYAIAVVDSKLLVGYGQEVMDPKDYYDFLLDTVEKQRDYIVCENFTYRNRNQDGAELFPVELIGITKFFMWDQPDRLYFQMPSIQGGKTAYFSDRRLQQMGLYIKGLQHGRSAVKHLLYWLQFGPGAKFGVDLDTAQLVDYEDLD